MKFGGKSFLVLAILLGAALRLVWSELSFSPPFANPQESMSKMYVRSAYLINAGLGYYQVESGSPAARYLDLVVIHPHFKEGGAAPEAAAMPREGLYPETLHPPGTSVVAALVMSATGLDGWRALQIAGLTFDLLGIVLIWLLANRLCPELPWLPLTSSLIYAVAPPLLGGVAAARDIAFVPPLSLLSVYAYVRYYDNRRRAWFFLSAMITGLAAYFRPDALLLTAFLGFAHVGEFIGRPTLRHLLICLARPALAIAIALSVLSPWAARNHSVIDRWVFTSTGSGCTLVTGLGTYPNPWGIGRSDLDRHKEAKEAGFFGAFDPGADNFFREKFISAVKNDPVAYGRILLSRIPMALAPPYGWGLRLRGETSWGEIRASGDNPLKNVKYLLRSYWPEMISALAALAGMVGIFVLHRSASSRATVWLILVLPYLYVVITHLLTHMAPYYLLPAIGSQIIGLAFLLLKVNRA